jgi:hypothetical protein
MYSKRFRGATVVIKFAFSCYKWGEKNTFCADSNLSHLRVLITPSPLSPVIPCYKRAMVLDFDSELPVYQPDFKKAKAQDDAEGIPALDRLKGLQLMLVTDAKE